MEVVENQSNEIEALEEKPKKPRKKMISKARKKACEKYNDFLELINLTGDYMMFQQHFIYLADALGYATAPKIINDILPEMKRTGLVKTTPIGSSQAYFLILKKTSIRHLKGVDSSQQVSAVKGKNLENKKILNLMKIDYLIEEIIPIFLKKAEEINKKYGKTVVKTDITTLKKSLRKSHCNLLMKQKEQVEYYKYLMDTELLDENFLTIRAFKRYALYNSARQKLSLNQVLSNIEQKALEYHENFYTEKYCYDNGGKEYEEIALLKNPLERDTYSQGGHRHQYKKEQAYTKVYEYKRLPGDPRLLFSYQKKNIYIRVLKKDSVELVMFNTKKSIPKDYFRNLLRSIYSTFLKFYEGEFKIKLTIYFFNKHQVNAFKTMFSNSKFDMQDGIHRFEIKAISMDIADEYLMTPADSK